MAWTDWISPALEGIGAIGSAWSTYMAGDAASRSAEAQAALYQQNAGWSRYEAEAIRNIAQQNWANANTEASRLEGIAESNARMIERLSLMQARGTTLIAGFNANSAIIDSEFDALAVERAAHRRAMEMKRESNLVQGSQVARYAKAGVEMSGSPMVVLNESIRLAEEDVANVLEGGRLEAETLRNRGEMSAALTRGAAQVQAGILSMQGQHEASLAREEGMLAADRLRWSADIQVQQAELSAQRSEAMAGIYGSQAGGMLDSASNSSLMGGVGTAVSVVSGAAKLLGNKTMGGWLSGLFSGGGAMGGGQGGAMAQGLANLGIGGGATATGTAAGSVASGSGAYLGGMWGGSAAAGGAAASAGASGAGAYLGGMWGGTAASGSGITATGAAGVGAGAAASGTATVGSSAGSAAGMGVTAGMSAIPVIGAIMAGMGIASHFLAQATDSSHTPESARASINADLAYISRYSGLLSQGVDATYPYLGSDYSPVNAALWRIRQLYQFAGYNQGDITGMLAGAGWSSGLPTQQPRRHWEYDEGTYG